MLLVTEALWLQIGLDGVDEAHRPLLVQLPDDVARTARIDGSRAWPAPLGGVVAVTFDQCPQERNARPLVARLLRRHCLEVGEVGHALVLLVARHSSLHSACVEVIRLRIWVVLVQAQLINRSLRLVIGVDVHRLLLSLIYLDLPDVYRAQRIYALHN